MPKQKCLSKTCKVLDNKKNCPCEYVNCERHGICCECIAYHKKHRDFPACLR